MDLAAKKQEIIAEIDRIDDDKLVWAIARLLHLDHEDDNDTPEWHKMVVRERMAKYDRGESKSSSWDEFEKTL